MRSISSRGGAGAAGAGGGRGAEEEVEVNVVAAAAACSPSSIASFPPLADDASAAASSLSLPAEDAIQTEEFYPREPELETKKEALARREAKERERVDQAKRSMSF